jgi:hypothetical protein
MIPALLAMRDSPRGPIDEEEHASDRFHQYLLTPVNPERLESWRVTFPESPAECIRKARACLAAERRLRNFTQGDPIRRLKDAVAYRTLADAWVRRAQMAKLSLKKERTPQEQETLEEYLGMPEDWYLRVATALRRPDPLDPYGAGANKRVMDALECPPSADREKDRDMAIYFAGKTPPERLWTPPRVGEHHPVNLTTYSLRESSFAPQAPDAPPDRRSIAFSVVRYNEIREAAAEFPGLTQGERAYLEARLANLAAGPPLEDKRLPAWARTSDLFNWTAGGQKPLERAVRIGSGSFQIAFRLDGPSGNDEDAVVLKVPRYALERFPTPGWDENALVGRLKSEGRLTAFLFAEAGRDPVVREYFPGLVPEVACTPEGIVVMPFLPQGRTFLDLEDTEAQGNMLEDVRILTDRNKAMLRRLQGDEQRPVALDVNQLNNFFLSESGYVIKMFDPFVFMGRDGTMPVNDPKTWTAGFDAAIHPQWAKLLQLEYRPG